MGPFLVRFKMHQRPLGHSRKHARGGGWSKKKVPSTGARLRPMFAAFSRAVHDLCDFGNGSRMKYVANLLVTIHNVASAEAMVLGIKSGLDPRMVYDLIRAGVGSSRVFEVRGPMMVAGQYDQPTATMETHLKDIDIIGTFAAELHCPTPLFTAAVQFYYAGVAQGRGGQDTAAVCAVLEKLAGIERKG